MSVYIAHVRRFLSSFILSVFTGILRRRRTTSGLNGTEFCLSALGQANTEIFYTKQRLTVLHCCWWPTNFIAHSKQTGCLLDQFHHEWSFFDPDVFSSMQFGHLPSMSWIVRKQTYPMAAIYEKLNTDIPSSSVKSSVAMSKFHSWMSCKGNFGRCTTVNCEKRFRMLQRQQCEKHKNALARITEAAADTKQKQKPAIYPEDQEGFLCKVSKCFLVS